MISAIILAAENGSKMNSNITMPCIQILGKPIIKYIVDSLKKANINNIICVVGKNQKDIMKILGENVFYVYQPLPLGTADAVNYAKTFLDKTGSTFIIPCDMPFLDDTLFNDFIDKHKKAAAKLTIGTFKAINPFGYGRVILNRRNEIVGIVEEGLATKKQKQINLVNSGLFLIENDILHKFLLKITYADAKNECHISDIVKVIALSHPINSFPIEDTFKVIEIKDLSAISLLEGTFQQKIISRHIKNGVIFVNHKQITIGSDVIIGNGATILPGTVILGHSNIGRNAVIGPNTEINNSVLGDNVNCSHSVVKNSRIGQFVVIGPFANISMGSIIEQDSRIGNFVEIKKSHIGKNTKASHLTYIGDTSCGENVNFGCGTITANYDGKNKYHTDIGSNVFIGCNSNLIAPIKIASNTFIACASTVTNDLKEGDFAISRNPQITKSNYTGKYDFFKSKE